MPAVVAELQPTAVCRQMDNFTLGLLTAPEVIAVNQDVLGVAGELVCKEGPNEVRTQAPALCPGTLIGCSPGLQTLCLHRTAETLAETRAEKVCGQAGVCSSLEGRLARGGPL